MVHRSKQKYNQEYWKKVTDGSSSSGKLGEAVVRMIFGLEEPFVEVKSCLREYYRVVVKVGQLERWIAEDKTYAIVIYRRHRWARTDRKGNRTYGCKYTITEAFEKNQLCFYFITAKELMEVIQESAARKVTAEQYQHSIDFWHVKWRAIESYIEHKYGRHTHIFLGDMPHRVYGTPPVCPKDWTPF